MLTSFMAKDDVAELHQRLPVDWLLSAGLINGRNVWRADLTEKYAQINALVGKRALWVASSCSLLHSPIDLSVETRLDTEVKSWFAFALQKCGELALLRDALNSGETAALEEWSAPIQARRHSRRVHNAAVEKRLAAITAQDSQRENPYEVRAEAQRARFKLPAWPTTTIGSFPQTTEIRGLRLDFKKGNLDANNYRTGIAEHIKTGYHRAGAFRAGCAGTWRSRAKRHGGILRRASGRLRLYPEWLGAKLWLPLCETAGSDWRYQPSGTDYRGVGEICPVADRQAGKRDVDRPGDYSFAGHSPAKT
ncbi:5-methyltetrahydropteroyltriglutamate--homocysteine S-methyltransferase [Salmonella enterica subsp. enterica]|uniref:5-methyltetrahydropteroyltriglutamate--homocysteine S-methyltransferase n=1 Tax=Salmonella enterica I TaxID=59201 RepID=A0A447TRC2_SALET|nr:5-methyltetrahydropteroyltriglutamate--homocysteine S-methyltransferase [Salmonella enterica subsp. enterica]